MSYPELVSNSGYVAFMQDGSYPRAALWSARGWQWRKQPAHEHPDHWHRDAADMGYGIAARGACALADDVPVSDLTYLEAGACARSTT